MFIKRIIYVLPFLICTAALLLSCDQSNDASESSASSMGKAEFSFTSKTVTRSDATEADIKSLIVTIVDTEGTIVYDQKKLEIFNFNGDFISPSISLHAGDYQLTDFVLLNEDDEAIYAAPKEGSKLGQLVQDPLTIDFTVTTDQVTKVVPEVILVDRNPSDYGYTTFSFEIVETFDLFISALIYNFAEEEANKNWELTTATITVNSGADQLYSESLEAKTNVIAINDGLSDYTITVKKPGYETYTQTFTNAELKASIDSPVIVSLIEYEVTITTTSSFTLVWDDGGSGGSKNGSFFRPIAPAGYYIVGHYGQPNYAAPYGTVVCVKESRAGNGAIKHPVDYQLVWEDRGSGADMDGAFWNPVPPAGYVALGMVSTYGYSKPGLTEVVCVREDLVVAGKIGSLIWDTANVWADSNMYTWSIEAVDSNAVNSGTFYTQAHSATAPSSGTYCLKNFQ